MWPWSLLVKDYFVFSAALYCDFNYICHFFLLYHAQLYEMKQKTKFLTFIGLEYITHVCTFLLCDEDTKQNLITL